MHLEILLVIDIKKKKVPNVFVKTLGFYKQRKQFKLLSAFKNIFVLCTKTAYQVFIL